MSLQLLAKQMESKGRDGDSVLVHMTHGEVAGLQKLAESAGGSLSVNPETGLVEANILESLLPTIIGGALMASGVGMPLAIAGGALAGGLQARQNDQDFLTGALMGGMGAYGGAGLAGSLGAAGAANAGATEMAKEAARQQALSQTANVAANIGTPAVMPAVAPSGFIGAGAEGIAGEAAAQNFLAQQAAPTSIYGTEAGAQLINDAYAKGASDYANKGFFDRVGGGFDALGTQTGRDAAMTQAGGGKGLFRSGLAALAPAAAAMTPEPAASPYPLMSMDIDRNVAPFQDIQAYEPNMPIYRGGAGNVYVPTFRAAEGGSTGGDSGGSDMVLTDDAARSMLGKSPLLQRMVGNISPRTLDRLGIAGKEAPAPAPAPRQAAAPELRAYEPEMPRYAYEKGTYVPTFTAAEGGLASLAKGGMKSGGFVVPADVVSMIGEGNTDAGYERIMAALPGSTPIKGKDGGQADTVKTSIEGKQPARVAHGEMYIPPETVKRMGGAKVLYSMMDKVRQQATGSKKQVKPVSLKRALA